LQLILLNTLLIFFIFNYEYFRGNIDEMLCIISNGTYGFSLELKIILVGVISVVLDIFLISLAS